jgi:hypothetical protein
MFFTKKVLVTCISSILLKTAFAQGLEKPPSCVQISGGNSQPVTLRRTSGAGLNGNYSATTPFDTVGYKVTKLELSAQCTSNGQQVAPTCAWVVDLSFCNRGTECNSSNKSYRTGTFEASGTGPVAFNIEDGGTSSFEGTYGSVDSTLNLQNFDLENFQINLCSNNINYGDNIFLQVNNVDNRWLSGGRSSGNNGVVTRDALASTFEQTGKSYEWTVRSNVSDGKVTSIDPKNGHCVKYGDRLHLQVNNLNNRWLSGGRSGGNNGVVTRDALGSAYEQTTGAAKSYEWIVRSAPGNGNRSFKDVRFGRCVEYGDIVNLEVNNLDNRWLTGGRSVRNEGVNTRDKFSTDNDNYERRVGESSYSWILRSELGDGRRP